MALTNDNSALDVRPLPVLPLAALDQLARLHVETSEASRLAKFLRASVHAASLFMLMGACVLFLGGGATIGRNFSWAVLVLAGVVGLLYSYIRTNAAFDRAPVAQAARNLRAILLYLGVAWGTGAFLAMPSDLSILPAILFAVGPALLLALLLNDTAGLLAFLTPAGGLTILAAIARPWPRAGFDAFLILVLSLFIGIAMRRRTPIPAGLALR